MSLLVGISTAIGRYQAKSAVEREKWREIEDNIKNEKSHLNYSKKVAKRYNALRKKHGLKPVGSRALNERILYRDNQRVNDYYERLNAKKRHSRGRNNRRKR